MTVPELRIAFSLDENIIPGTEEFNFPRYMKFWDSARPWLVEHGYSLFDHYYSDDSGQAFAVPKSPLNGTGGDFPHAFYDDGSTFKPQNADAHETTTMGRVVFAQDSQQRHVALKLVRHDSEEARILHLLLQVQRRHPDRQYIPGVLPLLELLPFAGHWLAVMPRWGEDVKSPQFSSVREIIIVIRDLLAGLVSLHSLRIAHHDIAQRNMLINHFPLVDIMIANNRVPVRRQVRIDGQAKYVLYDFNHSLLFPMSTDLRTCRSPRGWIGDSEVPDTSLGQYTYNPFAYDVWCLGHAISIMFQNVIPLVPVLAPLIERMTDWDTKTRFTAQEAQDFFAEQCLTITEEQLDAIPLPYSRNLEYDIWSELSPEFVGRWSHLRMRRLPIMRRLLGWLCRHELAGNIVEAVRGFLRL